LRPITHTSAKQLVPIANKPILFYGIEDLVAAGITDIGVIVGETAAEIRAALGDGSAFGATMTYIPQDAPLGLAHCVLIARDFLGDDEFVMYLGDNMLEQGLDEFVDQFISSRRAADEPELGSEPTRPVAQILLAHVEDPTAFGVAEIGPGGDVVSLVEKPVHPLSDLALVGVYLFDRHIHEAVAAIEPSERGELEITDAIAWLVDNGHRVEHRVLEGWWIDTGKKDPLLECNRLVLERVEPSMAGTLEGSSRLEGRVVIEEGARIVNSIVRGPAIIGRNTVMEAQRTRPFGGPRQQPHLGCDAPRRLPHRAQRRRRTRASPATGLAPDARRRQRGGARGMTAPFSGPQILLPDALHEEQRRWPT
jgi:glucose-1-phosphate thymidylyltransferase